MTLMMTSAQVVETTVNVTNNSPSRDYSHPDDQTTQTINNLITNIYIEGTLIFEITIFFIVSFSYKYLIPVTILSTSNFSAMTLRLNFCLTFTHIVIVTRFNGSIIGGSNGLLILIIVKLSPFNIIN